MAGACKSQRVPIISSCSLFFAPSFFERFHSSWVTPCHLIWATYSFNDSRVQSFGSSVIFSAINTRFVSIHISHIYDDYMNTLCHIKHDNLITEPTSRRTVADRWPSIRGLVMNFLNEQDKGVKAVHRPCFPLVCGKLWFTRDSQ